MMRISGNGRSKINVAGKWQKTAQFDPNEQDSPEQAQWDQDYNYLLSKYPGLMDRMDEIQQEAAQQQTELGPPPPGQIRQAVAEGISREFPHAMQDPIVLKLINDSVDDHDPVMQPMPQPMAQPMPKPMPRMF